LDVVAFIIGVVFFVVLDFLESANYVSLTGGRSSQPPVGNIVISWILTLGLFLVMYKMRHAAGYGVIAGFVGLFVIALASGVTGPYTCFSTYGYPFR
jgi:hypothetical protein